MLEAILAAAEGVVVNIVVALLGLLATVAAYYISKASAGLT